MSSQPSASSRSSASARELVLKRDFPVARPVVFQAWTDAAKMQKWWGPDGFTTPVCRLDPRAGGEMYLEMCGPPGTPWETPYPMYGAFVEVVEPERLIFRSSLKNADGAVFLENLNTVTFAESAGATEMTLHVRVLAALPEAEGPLAGMPEGWAQTLERLRRFVAP